MTPSLAVKLVRDFCKLMKYFARKVEYDGIKFDSKTEMERYIELVDMEEKGEILGLDLQTRFEIIPRLTKTVYKQLKTKVKAIERVDETAAHYTADFTYYKNGMYVIEEVKSKGTMLARDYGLRRKLIKQLIKKHNEGDTKCPWVFNEIIKK